MPIIYANEPGLGAEEFRDVLVASGLAELTHYRRPVADLERLGRMLANAGIVVTARDGARLVGVARAVCDFSYCCYLSDLAVDAAYQRRGIGRRLIEETRTQAGDGSTLLLIAAPEAVGFYSRIGMEIIESCWRMPRAR